MIGWLIEGFKHSPLEALGFVIVSLFSVGWILLAYWLFFT